MGHAGKAPIHMKLKFKNIKNGLAALQDNAADSFKKHI